MAHGCHGVSNHRHIDSVISNLFVLTIKNPPKLYCSFVRGNRPVPCGFPSQRASYSDSVSMSWWRRPRIDFPVTTSWQRRKYTTTPPMRHIEWLTTWAQCCYLLRWDTPDIRRPAYVISMMTSSNGNIFRVTGRCAWVNGWVNHLEAGYLRRQRAHYDVTVILIGVLYIWLGLFNSAWNTACVSLKKYM